MNLVGEHAARESLDVQIFDRDVGDVSQQIHESFVKHVPAPLGDLRC